MFLQKYFRVQMPLTNTGYIKYEDYDRFKSIQVAWITIYNASWLVSGKGQDMDITATHRW